MHVALVDARIDRLECRSASRLHFLKVKSLKMALQGNRVIEEAGQLTAG